jgi:hypothetical protein
VHGQQVLRLDEEQARDGLAGLGEHGPLGLDARLQRGQAPLE